MIVLLATIKQNAGSGYKQIHGPHRMRWVRSFTHWVASHAAANHKSRQKVWMHDTYDSTTRYHPDKRKLSLVLPLGMTTSLQKYAGSIQKCTSMKLGVTQPTDKALQSMYLLITDLEREFATNHQLDIGNPHRSQHASYGCHEGGSYPPWQQIHTLLLNILWAK
jgi:hypothetical protein